VRYYVSAVDWLGKGTDSPVETVEVRNDIAVTGLSVENSIISEMNHVQANVTVRNNGTLPLSFANLAVYANSTLMATYTVSDLRCDEDINVNTALVLPKGNYVITAYAAGLPDEVDTSNNARTAGVYNHYDIATSAVAASKTVVGQGYSASVNVTIKNQGNFTETFNVTVYANATVIGLENVTLPASSSTTITFTWNTTGFAYGNYTTSAVADTVPGEVDTTDNTYTEGTVLITIPGDITAPWLYVQYLDLGRVIGTAYGKKPNSPYYDPNADLNGDQYIQYLDLGILLAHYGQHYP
jgi:hypothetical protein